MTFDVTERMIVPEEDPEHAQFREGRLRAMGVTDAPHPGLDAVADRLREVTGAPMAMVNFVIEGRQYFAGLSTAAGPDGAGREMPAHFGFCRDTIDRDAALPLTDASTYARFAGDRLVAEMGLRAYLGVPVKDPATGVTLGTVCVGDVQPVNWTTTDVDNVKAIAEHVSAMLGHEEGRQQQD